MKRNLSFIITLLLFFLLLPSSISFAESIPVAINEISWAGSVSSGSDEWIELKNNTDEAIALDGFQLEDDSKVVLEFSGKTIPANSYFLIEKREESTSVEADLIFSGLSLANDGDTLRLLKDGQEIDSVNLTGGMWYGGSSTKKGTMSRLDSKLPGDNQENWQTESIESNFLDSGGMKIIGTPRTQNSALNNSGDGGSGGTQSGNKISLKLKNPSFSVGDELEILIQYEGSPGVFSYGLDLLYDKELLSFRTALSEEYLSEDGDIETSFQYGLEDSKEGVLLISEARLEEEKSGTEMTSGSLALIKFELLEETLEDVVISFGPNSFVNDKNEKLNISFTDFKFNLVSAIPDLGNPTNLAVELGSDRYSFLLNFEKVPGASGYVIYRRAFQNEFKEVFRTSTNQYLDDKEIIPQVFYEYKISAILSDNLSTGTNIQIKETRGILGDFDRNDRVDGLDLDRIAKAWTVEGTSPLFDFSLDTNCDFKIDALDLFALSAHFGEVY